MKCSLRMQFDELRSCLAEEWGTAQAYAHSALGHCPSPPGQLPKDYMVMAIGNRGDHIFQGIIYCRPRHPLLLEAIIQFYSPTILEGAASDYLIFCKFLYGAVRENLGHPPQHGWNISSRYGPIHLLRERRSKDLQSPRMAPCSLGAGTGREASLVTWRPRQGMRLRCSAPCQMQRPMQLGPGVRRLLPQARPLGATPPPMRSCSSGRMRPLRATSTRR